MQPKNPFQAGILITIIGVIITLSWLGLARPVNAQCGSQASSCKNCHEVQGEMPVNADGTGWHQSHAFGDFCYICHAGNNQAIDKTEAHTGMVPPLDDIRAACQQCHVADLEARAQVYAEALGVEIGAGAAEHSAGVSTESAAAVASGVGLMAPTELDVNDPNMTDYVERYNRLVLGQKPLNLGNLIVSALIGLVLLGGGAFVIHNEGWMGVDYQKVDQYPAELVSLLPKIARLNPPTRKKLAQILEDREQADALLAQVEPPQE